MKTTITLLFALLLCGCDEKKGEHVHQWGEVTQVAVGMDCDHELRSCTTCGVNWWSNIPKPTRDTNWLTVSNALIYVQKGNRTQVEESKTKPSEDELNQANEYRKNEIINLYRLVRTHSGSALAIPSAISMGFADPCAPVAANNSRCLTILS